MRWANMLSKIEARIIALQVKVDEAGGCNCRQGESTAYHTAADLAAILATRCPVHDFCQLGDLQWVPTSMPLRFGDQALCTCPPSATRDFLQKNRGPLTYAEQQNEQCILQEEFTDNADQRFMVDQAKVKYLLQRYEQERNHRFSTCH
jgi:hypothetical protein